MRVDKITVWEPELMKSDQGKIPKKGSSLPPVKDTLELSGQANALNLKRKICNSATKKKIGSSELNGLNKTFGKGKLGQIQKKMDSGFYSDRQIYSAVAEKLLRLFGT